MIIFDPAPRSLAAPAGIGAETAEGGWITAASGTRYLDLGPSATHLLGHRHPAVLAAVRAQLSRERPGRPDGLAARGLAALAPPGLDRALFVRSGGAATEAAVTLARAATGRTGLAHLAGSYHGETAGALSLADGPARRGSAPVLAGVLRLPRDDPGRAAELVAAHQPAAVFVEPVQSEGGVHPVTPAPAVALRQACDEVGALLVADETRSGLGRCGVTWAHTALGVTPDVLLIGDALGGGLLPVAALVATRAAYEPVARDPLLFGTAGAGPEVAAAVLGTLRVVGEEDVPAAAARTGAALRSVLERLVDTWPDLFAGVTGRGALLGLHTCRADARTGMIRRALAERVMLGPCLAAPAVLRCTPPAFLTEEDLAFAETALHRAAAGTARELAR